MALIRPQELAPRWVFLGTDKGKGIYRAPWNHNTGELGKIELAIETPRPDFFAMHPTLAVMYSVNSVGAGNGAVSSFQLDTDNASLTLLNSLSSLGDGPCAVSVDRTGKSAFCANYNAGSMAAFSLAADGHLTRNNGFDCRGNPDCGALGPNHDRQDAAHLHCVTVSPDNNFLLVCNLGEDAIEVFPIYPGGIASEILGDPTRIAARPGSGPRHVAFHHNGKWLYCIHELDCTIDLYDWSVQRKRPIADLRKGSTISTLATGTPLTGNTGCEIVISDGGSIVYACSRGVDQITVYRVNPATGLLTEQQRVSCGGQIPRYIALDPSRKWLVCCNQGAATNPVGTVTVFAHDPATGKLNPSPKTYAAETPMFVDWV
jgi:6-phosphogluconolactonase